MRAMQLLKGVVKDKELFEILTWIHRAKQCGFRWSDPTILMKGKKWIWFQSNHRDQIIIDIGKPLSRRINDEQPSCVACPIEQLSAFDVQELGQAMLDIKELSN